MPPLDQPQLESLIRAITEEIVSYLGGPRTDGSGGRPLACAGLGVDELVCPGCEQSCAQNCALKTRRVIEAGACRISAGCTVTEVDAEIARLIDHTLLKPDATRDEVTKLANEALRFCFASVCINPWYVPLAATILRGSGVKVCTVVGFPLGATLPRVKIFEAEESIKLGAEEIDMVINVGALKSGQDDVVEQDIRGVAAACHRDGAILKVIIEAALLNNAEKVRACVAAKNAAADFVKTSTGFGPGGATAEDVALMRAVVGHDIEVKAAGGIRTLEDLQKMVSAGATRIGASASVKILEQAHVPLAQPPQPAASAQSY